MQEELLKKASLRRVQQAFERERQRRIQEMETLLSVESEESVAMADTNARLSLVHEDLKNAFRIMEVISTQIYRELNNVNSSGLDLQRNMAVKIKLLD
jgi:hypothetical protein